MFNCFQKRVLIAPLHWGLGHAARCVPVIKTLLQQQCEVMVFADNEIIAFLKQRFPDLVYINDDSRPYSYKRRAVSIFRLTTLSLKLRKSIRKDRRRCAALYDQFLPDIIVSDNRYGFYDRNAYNIIITHQIQPVLPATFHVFSCWVHKRILQWLKPFNEVFIPDYEHFPGLAGTLSHSEKHLPSFRFIGPLSRFQQSDVANPLLPDVFDVFITTGPSEHRKELVRYFLEHLRSKTLLVVIGVKGDPVHNTILFFESPDDHCIQQAIVNARYVISHTGYSTLMDLEVLHRKAILFPTSGQSEQEYLAQLHKNTHKIFKSHAEVVDYINNN